MLEMHAKIQVLEAELDRALDVAWGEVWVSLLSVFIGVHRWL